MSSAGCVGHQLAEGLGDLGGPSSLTYLGLNNGNTNNPISSLPTEIGALTGLEVLYRNVITASRREPREAVGVGGTR